MEYLNRYTTLPIALDILTQKRITLLSPEAWEDRNDAYYLEKYRTEMKRRTVVAICFSACRETFHHWKVFSNGNSGVCIEFDKDELVAAIGRKKGFTMKEVEYLMVDKVERSKPELGRWPFIKRLPYKDEKEFRIIWESDTELVRSKTVIIDLSCIKKVTLSPWLPKVVGDSVTSVIRGIDGCEDLKINSSSLLENSRWRQAIE
jgi:hypothetical protein